MASSNLNKEETPQNYSIEASYHWFVSYPTRPVLEITFHSYSRNIE